MKTLTRFAPSPTGYLHIGHAASAWFAWDQGGQSADTFILRVEDIDQTRCRPEFEDALYEDLRWLELDWIKPVRRQSDHFQDYKKSLQRLEDMGLIYPCFCTRKEIEEEIARAPSAPHVGENALYPGSCKSLSEAERADKIAAGLPYALRLDTQKAVVITGDLRWFDRAAGWQQARPDLLGDVVLARKDTPASYHLCVTHDDDLQQIGLVARGNDLFESTHIHRLLQELLGYTVPEYHHHPLLTDKDGRRFAKRDKSLTLREIRARGFSAAQLRRMIGASDLSDLF